MLVFYIFIKKDNFSVSTSNSAGGPNLILDIIFL